MQIINLTPHTVNIVNAKGHLIDYFESEGVARCEETVTHERTVNDLIKIIKVTYGKTTGLPEEQKPDCPYCGQFGGVSQFDTTCGEHGEPTGPTLYIVSAMVRQANPERKDLLSPGPLVRDEKGQPIGCLSLIEN